MSCAASSGATERNSVAPSSGGRIGSRKDRRIMRYHTPTTGGGGWMTIDTTRATGGFGDPLPERDILEGFGRLIAADRLFGADLNATVIKKSGKGNPVLVRRPPSHYPLLPLCH